MQLVLRPPFAKHCTTARRSLTNMGQTSTVINIPLPIFSFLEALMPFTEGKSSGQLFPNTHHWTAVQFQSIYVCFSKCNVHFPSFHKEGILICLLDTWEVVSKCYFSLNRGRNAIKKNILLKLHTLVLPTHLPALEHLLGIISKVSGYCPNQASKRFSI